MLIFFCSFPHLAPFFPVSYFYSHVAFYVTYLIHIFCTYPHNKSFHNLVHLFYLTDFYPHTTFLFHLYIYPHMPRLISSPSFIHICSELFLLSHLLTYTLSYFLSIFYLHTLWLISHLFFTHISSFSLLISLLSYSYTALLLFICFDSHTTFLLLLSPYRRITLSFTLILI